MSLNEPITRKQVSLRGVTYGLIYLSARISQSLPISLDRCALGPPFAPFCPGRLLARWAAGLYLAPATAAVERIGTDACAHGYRRRDRVAPSDRAQRSLWAAAARLPGKRRRAHLPLGRGLADQRTLFHR